MQVPYFNAPIFLENKTQIGKVEEILGPINGAVSAGTGCIEGGHQRGLPAMLHEAWPAITLTRMVHCFLAWHASVFDASLCSVWGHACETHAELAACSGFTRVLPAWLHGTHPPAF